MSDKLPDDVVSFLHRCYEAAEPPFDMWANDLLHKYAPPTIITPGKVPTETWATIPLPMGEAEEE